MSRDRAREPSSEDAKGAEKVGGDMKKFMARATDELATLAASIREVRAETGEGLYEIRSRMNALEHRLVLLERKLASQPAAAKLEAKSAPADKRPQRSSRQPKDA